MNVYFAILTVIFGPLIFMAFLRWLSKRVRRHVAKAEILSPDECLRKYGLTAELAQVGVAGTDGRRTLEELNLRSGCSCVCPDLI